MSLCLLSISSTQASIYESIHPSIYSFISWTHQESFGKFCLFLEQCIFIQNRVQQVKCFTNHLSYEEFLHYIMQFFHFLYIIYYLDILSINKMIVILLFQMKDLKDILLLVCWNFTIVYDIYHSLPHSHPWAF